MKKTVFFLLSIVFFGGLRAQKSDSLVLHRDLQAYMEAMANGRWDRVIDMIYPELFKLQSKEELRSTLENGVSNYNYSMQIFPSTDIRVVADTVTPDGRRYALVAYTNRFTLTYKRHPGEDDVRFHARMNYTYYRLSKSYPPGQIIEGSEPGTYHFRLPKYLIAVYMPERKGYTFLEFPVKEGAAAYLKQLLDPGVVDYFDARIRELSASRQGFPAP
ncbi:MAG: hypothetical protein GXO27_00050 [Chlorobi bacterium]|nr:hypothetical protein [Chlorobiota bacterium]